MNLGYFYLKFGYICSNFGYFCMYLLGYFILKTAIFALEQTFCLNNCLSLLATFHTNWLFFIIAGDIIPDVDSIEISEEAMDLGSDPTYSSTTSSSMHRRSSKIIRLEEEDDDLEDFDEISDSFSDLEPELVHLNRGLSSDTEADFLDSGPPPGKPEKYKHSEEGDFLDSGLPKPDKFARKKDALNRAQEVRHVDFINKSCRFHLKTMSISHNNNIDMFLRMLPFSQNWI